ncbi:hypothetical protein CIHG_02853 [Coccidioides immitis H538.4]|uniref:Uncharacterized protein n=1 Tax=Coccidioides immitis H538.4 TaxID=396776 RepID=A0A0J8RK98_COCIT|nr:hypothetical protein CIHG_02853 [Coccidioides immitis H538.4]
MWCLRKEIWVIKLAGRKHPFLMRAWDARGKIRILALREPPFETMICREAAHCPLHALHPVRVS